MSELSEIPINTNLYTVAFYNTENLFDIYDDKKIHDNDLLPTSDKRWTKKRYDNKLRKLGYTISNIGKEETGKHPTLVGLAEVENASVLRDLIRSKHLDDLPYNFVHFNSKDERGIDVCLLYDETLFNVIASETFSIELFDDAGLADYTRDILLVSGMLEGFKIHVIVNHWSSRREGEKETQHKRIAASDKVGDIISNLRLHDEAAKIIVMGDFNDDPSSKSITRLVTGFDLYNPMEALRSFSRGSTKHGRKWDLFDQILVTNNVLDQEPDSLHYETANIFDADFLKLFSGKFKGSPFRTYIGKRYQGGYSDHFPVYMILKKHKKSSF